MRRMAGRQLLVVSGVLEAGAAAGLAAAPSALLPMLLGSSFDTPAGLVVSRVTAAALVALGVACWLACNDAQSGAAKGLITAMLLYNAAVCVVLFHAATALRVSAIGLWPTVVLHAAMAVWCIACLHQSRKQP